MTAMMVNTSTSPLTGLKRWSWKVTVKIVYRRRTAMNGRATTTARGTRLSFKDTFDTCKLDAKHTTVMATNATMYSAMPTLLLVATLIAPFGSVLPFVPPTMLKTRPAIIHS